MRPSSSISWPNVSSGGLPAASCRRDSLPRSRSVSQNNRLRCVASTAYSKKSEKTGTRIITLDLLGAFPLQVEADLARHPARPVQDLGADLEAARFQLALE